MTRIGFKRIEFNKIQPRQYIGPAIICALLLALYYRTIEWMFHAWWHSEQYSHGFLILPVAAFIVWTRRHELQEKHPLNHGLWLLGAGLGIYIFGLLRISNFYMALSLFLVLPGLILFARGTKALRAVAFPIFLLVFMIPFPWLLDKLGTALQAFAARAATWIVDLMGVSVTRTGSQVQLENAAFNIDVPCSGLHSLIALLALAAIFAYVLKGPFKRKAILFALAVPVAIFANLVRIVALLLIGNKWGEDVAINWVHDPADIIIFLVAIIIMPILARLLGFKLLEAPE